MCSKGCCAEKCSLDHSQPEIFDKSQWCAPAKVSTWYMIYRVVVALVFAGGICGHMVNSKQGAKWFIYMTDQGIMLLGIHFLLDACLVVARWSWELAHNGNVRYHESSQTALSPLYKISWAMNSCFFSIALWISLVYWSVLHKFVVEAHLLQNQAAVYLNIFLHAVNSLACLIDIFVTGRPWKAFHFMWAIVFGVYYAGFSLIYWGAGGVGICYKTQDGHPTATVHTQDGLWCDPFIYPILNWDSQPLLAAGMIAGGCIVLPLIHFFWMGLAALRSFIYSKTLGKHQTLPDGVDRMVSSTLV